MNCQISIQRILKSLNNRKQYTFYSEKYLEEIEEEINKDYLENKNDEYNVEKDDEES